MGLGLLSVVLGTAACAGPKGGSPLLEQILVQQQERIELQERALESLREEVSALRTEVAAVRGVAPEAFADAAPTASLDVLASARGAGAESTDATGDTGSDESASPSSTAQSAPENASPDSDAEQVAQEQTGERPLAQREKELEESIPPRVGGVLLKEGHLQLEPQIRYAFSSVNRVEITGYTILPAITLGLVEVTKRDTSSFTTFLGIRYGLLDRLEIDFGIPFVAGWSRAQFSPVNTDPPIQENLNAEGYNIGDLRLGLRTQLNNGTDKIPSFIAGLSARFPTGIDPYEVERYTDSVHYVEKELPTGTGFYALSPTVSFVYPTEPGVLFGNFRYTWNIPRDIESTDSQSGQSFGNIDPGDVISGSLGFGLSLNDSFSVLFSYDHAFVFKTQQDGHVVQGSNPLQIGTLGIGGTWRSGPRTSYNLYVGIGVTDDAPDVSVGLRVPINFDLYRRSDAGRN